MATTTSNNTVSSTIMLPVTTNTTNWSERTYTLAELNRAIDIARNLPETVARYASTVDRRSRTRAIRRAVRDIAVGVVNIDD